ncbi:hypothetical protein Acr_17g0006600 [Actinidia rufa]|uniref:Uncharacterized protein n=1 Tax=Actinidia rufa TaxID=165716 RepID=A0A7J0G2U8_9ERIC|nr:hypothetical protein Acr_17g0006600 [Actinidia rufa]
MTATRKTQWTPSKDLPLMALIDESIGSSDEALANELGVGLGWQGRMPSLEAQWGKKRANGPSSSSEVTVKPHADSNNATIANCLQVFMGLPNDDVRLAWLQLHRDQVVGTAPQPFPAPYTRPHTPSYYYPRQP